MTKNYKRGFTLIELLVVIAIIGILAGIVLAALGTTRQKGADAGIQGDIDTIRTQAEVYASNNSNSYTGMCTTDTTITNALTAARSTSGASGLNTVYATPGAAGASGLVTCHVDTAANAAAWAVESPLKSNNLYMWCADSTGKVGTTTTALTASDTTCN